MSPLRRHAMRRAQQSPGLQAFAGVVFTAGFFGLAIWMMLTGRFSSRHGELRYSEDPVLFTVVVIVTLALDGLSLATAVHGGRRWRQQRGGQR